jgi:hypothetical protein
LASDGSLRANWMHRPGAPGGPHLRYAREDVSRLQVTVWAPENAKDTVLAARLQRDGWGRAGPLGPERVVHGPDYTVVCDDDPGWFWRPSAEHPTLRMFYRGYGGKKGYIYEFRVDDRLKLLETGVTWATWDCLGQLLVARQGRIERYTLADLQRGLPSFVRDLESLSPPPRRKVLGTLWRWLTCWLRA